MPFTPQQQQAIETRDVSVALAAGAGCGKTFVLTQRFLAELRRSPTADNLASMMAITFTDRAAREMRDRIREAVRQELQSCPDADLPAWQEILRELESARIQTIHAFCGATLRAHAVELGIDPDFAVLDEPTANALLNEVLQQEVTRLLRERNPDLQELVLRYGLEGTLSRLRDLMQQRFQLTETRSQAPDESELGAFWREYHQTHFIPARIKQLAIQPAVESLHATLLEHEPTAPKMKQRRPILLRHLETLLRVNSVDDNVSMPALRELDSAALLELRENMTVQGATAKHWESPEIHERVKQDCETLREDLKKLLPMLELNEEDLELSVRYGLQALRLTERLAAAYSQAKRERAVLDFDDLLLGLRDLLREQPTVQTELSRRSRFLLLDEFQDTDPVQTAIVEAICGERLTTGGLFLVGDVKQSIYRFRRADPNVFRSLRGRIPAKGRMALTKNFRSQQEILDFVNFLFEPAMRGEYDPLEAFDAKRHAPKTKVEFLQANDPDVPEKFDSERKRALEADWIAARIVELLQDSTPRIREKQRETQEVPLRPVRPGDIVVLFRAFSNLAVYEDALRRAGVDYYVVGGRAFYAQQEVYDIANLCRFLDDDSDEVALAGVLRSPLFGLSDDTLMLLAVAQQGLARALRQTELPEGLAEDQATLVQGARQTLQELLEFRWRLRIGPLLRHAISSTAYDAALLTEFMGERKVANLRKLIDMADDYDAVGMLGLADFADRLLESIDEESREELAATHPESGNVVRLMTVHQSKGLEFPVVVAADINRPLRGNSKHAVLSPQLGPLLQLPKQYGNEPKNPALEMYRYAEKLADEEEAIRLFYVATTRAADHLILSTYWDSETTAAGPWMKLLSERFDLATGLPRGDAILGQTATPGEDWRRIPVIQVITEKPRGKLTSTRAHAPRLWEWPELLATAEPVAPPALALPLARDCSGRERFSVSELEEAAAALQHSLATPKSASRAQKSAARGEAEGSKSVHTAVGFSPSEAEELGNLLHAAMEQFNPQDPPDPEAFLLRLCENSPSKVADSLRQEATRRFQSLLQSELLEELRSAQALFREVEFLLHWQSPEIAFPAIIAGTIDCLLQDTNGEWHLLDYKTGGLPEQPAAVLEKYGVQMTVYSLAIQQLTGSLPESIRIGHLSAQPRLIRLPLDQSTIEQVRPQVDQAITALRSRLPLAE